MAGKSHTKRRHRTFGAHAAALSGAAFIVAPSTAAARDFYNPEERTRQDTAYSLAPGQYSVEIGALATGNGDAFARLGFARGFDHGFEVSANLAHAAAGIINLNTKWNFFDKEYLGFAAHLGVIWAHGDWLWVVPAAARNLVSTLDVLAIPVGVVASAPLTSWFQLDLDVTYLHAEVFGNANSDNVLLDAQIGARQVALSPTARFYLADKLELFFGAHLAPYTAIPGSAEIQTMLADDIYAGGQTGGYKEIPFEDTYRFSLGARSAITRTTFVHFTLQYGSSAEKLYGSKLYPSFGMEFRF